jgi:hypothetical protein
MDTGVRMAGVICQQLTADVVICLRDWRLDTHIFSLIMPVGHASGWVAHKQGQGR